MRKIVVIIAALLVIPAAIYMGWALAQDKVQTAITHTLSTLQRVQDVPMVKALPRPQPGLFERIWSKLDRVGSAVSMLLGIAVALKELHGSKKRKKKATPKAGG